MSPQLNAYSPRLCRPPADPLAATPHTRSAGLAPLLAVCCGYFIVILDVTIVNVAAPAIGRELNTSLTALQRIVDGYTVAFAGLLLLGGALGDRWGNRRVFCIGVGVFTVAARARAFGLWGSIAGVAASAGRSSVAS